MNVTEYLLTQLGEEASEISQMCSKSVRFGLREVWPSDTKNPAKQSNVQRLVGEINDFWAVVQMMQEQALLPCNLLEDAKMDAKQEKVEKYMDYAVKECGTLENHLQHCNLAAPVDSRACTQTEADIDAACKEVADLLKAKNRDYGDSALTPKRIFSRLDAAEGIKIRIDDKLSRVANDHVVIKEDSEMDLLGYLILLRVAKKRAKLAAG